MADHKIVTCASYGNSGSGVITDYLMEFRSIYNTGDFEFRFLHDYGGVTTLEDSLIRNHHRLNSDIAIQNFLKYVDYQSGDIFNRRYEKYFNNQFKKISYNFLDKLIEAQWDGYWDIYQVLSHPIITFFKYKVYPRFLKVLHGNKYYIARYVPRKKMYFSNPSEEYFMKCVQEYINDLCDVIDLNNEYNFLYFDQLLPPLNINRYFRYFNQLKVVVVDRDPRDYYIENYKKWKEGYIPQNIDQFIAVYKGIRKKIDQDESNDNILRIKFEDTIYNYAEFKSQINTFLDIKEEDHILPLSEFNPKKSIENTQLWKKYNIPPKIISKIEDELGIYCYHF
jgi:hypothetical protein